MGEGAWAGECGLSGLGEDQEGRGGEGRYCLEGLKRCLGSDVRLER